MKNKRFLFFAILFILLILAPIVLNQYYNWLLGPASIIKSEQIFIIKPAQPVSQIAANLQKAGLVRNALAFRLLISQMGIAKNIQAGDFRLSPDMSSKGIAQLLTHGAIDVWVTIPEGLRIEEIASRVEEKLKFGANDKYQFGKKEFIDLAQEGYMFPDTYLIPKDATAADVVARLKKTFEEKVPNELLEAGSKNNLTHQEVILLASLVEREAKSGEERPVIAGILLNRLNSAHALQVDATIQYAKGYDAAQNTWWPPVTLSDYQSVKSAYNTYLFPGLPPGPIASPGLEAIRAAAEPADTDYFYYLHDSEGRIHYAKTQEEHNENIRKFLL